MGLLKKLGKAIFPGTGRHAAKRAEKAANQYAAEAQRDRELNERKTARERRRAQKLSVRGLRSKRTASFFQPSSTEGSATIG